LRAADQYVTVYEVTGEYDVVAVGRFRDTAELNERVGELVTTEGVAEVTTAVVLDTVADDFTVAAPRRLTDSHFSQSPTPTATVFDACRERLRRWLVSPSSIPSYR